MDRFARLREQEVQYLVAQNKKTDDLLDAIFGDGCEDDIDNNIVINDSKLTGVLPENIVAAKGFFSPSCSVEKIGLKVVVSNDTGKATALVSDLQKYFSPDEAVVPLPNSRNVEISGQAKLIIDVGLAIPSVKRTDNVLVVGGYSQCRGGLAYSLLAGHVAVVDIYDPHLPETKTELVSASNNVVTEFNYFSQEWDVNVVSNHEVLFNDAYIERDGVEQCIEVLSPNARVVSLKRFKHDGFSRGDTFRYDQVRATSLGEWREVKPDRVVVKYRGKFGLCPMCVELDYFSPGDYRDVFRRLWGINHTREMYYCSNYFRGRPPDAIYAVPELGVVTVKPVYSWVDPNVILLPFSEILKPDTGQVQSFEMASGSIPVGSLRSIVSRYVDFTVCESNSTKIYSTTCRGRSCDKVVLPYVLTPAVLIENFLIIGVRVFELVVIPSKSSKLLRGTDLITFVVPQFSNVKSLVLKDGGVVKKKFTNWITLNKMVWHFVKGD